MLLAVVLMLAQAGAEAKGGSPGVTGNLLLSMCEKYDGGSSVDSAYCISYVAGFTDAVVNYEVILEMTRAFDHMRQAAILARVGALPKGYLEHLGRISKGPNDPAGKTIAALAKLQSEALAQGPPPRALEGADVESLVHSQVCIPTGTTNEQHLRVIVKYLRDHPEKLHEPAGSLSLEALKAAFPCRNEK